MKARFACALGLGSLAAVAARAEVEFAGYMRTPQGEARFVLTDPAAQKTSEWIGVGGSFVGYRVTGFEPRSEMLAVEKEGAVRQLRLKNTAVVAVGADKAKSSSPMTEEEVRAEKLVHQAMMQEFMAKEHESFRQRLQKLRETLPAGHPEILQAEDIFARFTPMTERDAVQLDRAKRIMLLKKIREHGDGDPQEMATLQAALRDLDIRLARERAEMPPAAAP